MEMVQEVQVEAEEMKSCRVAGVVPEDLPFLSTISFDQDLRLPALWALWVLCQDAIRLMRTDKHLQPQYSGFFGTLRGLESRL